MDLLVSSSTLRSFMRFPSRLSSVFILVIDSVEADSVFCLGGKSTADFLTADNIVRVRVPREGFVRGDLNSREGWSTR